MRAIIVSVSQFRSGSQDGLSAFLGELCRGGVLKQRTPLSWFFEWKAMDFGVAEFRTQRRVGCAAASRFPFVWVPHQNWNRACQGSALSIFCSSRWL